MDTTAFFLATFPAKCIESLESPEAVIITESAPI